MNRETNKYTGQQIIKAIKSIFSQKAILLGDFQFES